MVVIHPRTRQRISVMPNTGDVQAMSNSSASIINNEDVPVIGKWTDEDIEGNTSTGGTPTKQLMMSPTPNKFFGTDAGLEGTKLSTLTKRGKTAIYYRQERKTVQHDGT